MPFTLTRALRVLASSLGLSTVRRSAAAATKAVPPSTGLRRRERSRQTMSAALAAQVQQIVDRPQDLLSLVAKAGGLEPLEGRAMMSATYYVSATGNDANAGTSASSPWKTIAKADTHHFVAGDQLLFQGGQTFSGNLKLSGESGTASDPIVIGSYGSGRATLAASGSGDAIYAYNSGGVTVKNLVVTGKPATGNTQQYGIKFEDNSKGTKLAPVTVTGCDVSGFYAGGILVLADQSNTTYTAETITNDTLHDNVLAGLFTWAPDGDYLQGLYVGYDTAYDNYGTTAVTDSGNGIMISHAQYATVEHDAAYNNDAKGGGGVGIWAFSSDHVTIQYCSSVGNKTNKVDGDGFDFDADTSNSVMQYNYAADNAGGGFLVDQWFNDSKQTNDVVRFNVAQDNGQKGGYGDLEAWGKVINAQFYNNTVYTGNNSDNAAVRIHNYTITGLHASGLYFTNNIFVTTGGAQLINAPAEFINGSSNVNFAGNVYYSSGAATHINYDGKAYSSLAAFQAGTGQEKVNGKAVGSAANPMLVAAGKAGLSPTISTNIATYTADYQLQADSPVTTAGVSLQSVRGITLSGTDLYGDAVSSATSVPGADAVKGSTASPTTTPTTTPTPTPTSTPTTTPTPTPTSTPTSTSTSTGTAPKLTGWDLNVYGKAGSTAQSGSTVTMSGSGADIWNAADSFRYSFTSLTGNGQIVAQVTSLSDANAWAKAGVMIRNGIGSNAAEASLTFTPGGYTQFISRNAAGAASTGTTVARGSAAYVKLVRTGNVFAGYTSADGKTWTLVSQQTIAMGATVDIGLAVTAHDRTKLETATFKNVAVTKA